MNAMTSLRVLTWNIHKCRGTDRRLDPERVLSVISSIAPDVAVLQEADRRFGRSRAIFEAGAIKALTGLDPCGAGTSAAMGWRGNLVLARPGLECVDFRQVSLPSLEPRGAVFCRLRGEAGEFDVIGMHLALAGPWRRLQSEAIAAQIQMRDVVPTIVAGDSNDWRRKSRALAAIEDVLGAPFTRVKSFPSGRPVLALDRIVAGRGARVSWIAANDAFGASDHAPVVSAVALSPLS